MFRPGASCNSEKNIFADQSSHIQKMTKHVRTWDNPNNKERSATMVNMTTGTSLSNMGSDAKIVEKSH